MFQSSQKKLWRWKDTSLTIIYLIKYSCSGFGKIWISKFIYVIFHIFCHSLFACLALRWRGNIISQSPNRPPLLFVEALAAREPKYRTFFPHPYNIGVEILVLSSVVLISNIGLLTAEALTGELNEKYPTFNEEPSPDNYKVETILIGYFCVQPTSTCRKVVFAKTSIMGALFHLRVIVQHHQWRHYPISNIQLVLWVVLHLMLVLVMVKLVWDLAPPTLPLIKFTVGLMVEIFCGLRLGNIYTWVIHTKKGTIINHIFKGRITALILVMVDVVLVLGQPTSTPKYIFFQRQAWWGFSKISVSAHITPHGVI